MLDLAKLKSGELVVLIAAAMVCAEDLEGFLVAAARDEPSCVKYCEQKIFVNYWQAKIDLLGLSGTHHVKATEINDGKIWISDTLLQLQSDWIVSVPKQIQAAMVAPKL
jgi:hypothetical protein